MSYLYEQRARDLARKGARLWSAAAGGRSGLVAPIGSGTRQGGGGRPSLDRQNITANDPVQGAIVFPDVEIPGNDGIAPAAPTLTTPFSSYVYQDNTGASRAAIIVVWTEPLDGDGAVIEDGGWYEVQWRLDTEVDWSSTFVGFDSNRTTILGLDAGSFYDVRVRAADTFSNNGDWSAIVNVEAVADTIPPSDPAAPSVVAGNPLRIQVIHDLGRDGEVDDFSLERDLAYLEVHVGTSAGFTVSSATKVGTMRATAGMLDLQVSAVGSFDAPGAERWVRVVAVDLAGNASGASSAVAVTASLVDTAFIADAAITNAKIQSLSASKLTAGTIDASVITVSNLDASNITSGVLSANFISGGTINGNFVNVINLNAGNITTGTLNAGAVSISAGQTTITSNGIQLNPGLTGDSRAIRWGTDGPSLRSDGTGLYVTTGGGLSSAFMRVAGAIQVQDIFGVRTITGTKTTSSTNWAATGNNGNTSNVFIPAGGGSHTHSVPYHTHSLTI